ncbi:MAG: hypothetical protein KGQ36_06440 [Rickettsiales bacterium]|nr:hypothetical protein [Rickettsiales bacterium]
MNNKKFLISLASVFAFTYVVDFFLHNNFLKSSYEATKSLWRHQDEMMSMLHLSIIVHIIFAIVVIQFFKDFVFVDKKHSLHDSLGAGLLIGEMIGIIQLSFYISMPIPPVIAIAWFTARVIQCVGASYILWVIDQKIK